MSMQEMAVRYRELYILTERSYALCQSLADRAWEDKRDEVYVTRQDEARTLWTEARHWHDKWKHAGGPTYAPIRAYLSIQPTSSPQSCPDTSGPEWEGVIILADERTRRAS